jgi:putative phosphonate metabolism protein
LVRILPASNSQYLHNSAPLFSHSHCCDEIAEPMTSPARYALYYTPAVDSDLARLGATLLGYDCHTGLVVEQPLLEGITSGEMLSVTEDPRRYGFHGTLKAPFSLDTGAALEELKKAVGEFAAEWPSFEVGPMSPRRLGRFIAFTPDVPSVELSLFAAECVAAFDRFRGPITEKQRQRRGVDRLSPRQRALFERWGYPYVFDEFRFHMTLTGPLPDERHEAWMAALRRYSGGPKALAIDALTLMVQPNPAARFQVVERFELKGQR